MYICWAWSKVELEKFTTALQLEEIRAHDWTDFGALYFDKLTCVTFKGQEYDASKCKEILDAFTELNRCSNTLTTNGIDTDGYTKYSAVSDSEVLG